MAELDLLYADHWHWLKGWLARRTQCVGRAEDLAQDTFCRLLDHGATTGVRDARGYLATIARRLLIDDVRRRKVEQAILAALASDLVVELSPERIVAAKQLLEHVMQILEQLPQQARDVFVLRRIEGLQQSEIAERLGLSLSTVKRHIARVYALCYAIAELD